MSAYDRLTIGPVRIAKKCELCEKAATRWLPCEHDWKLIEHWLCDNHAERIDDCVKCGAERRIRTRRHKDGSFGKGTIRIKSAKVR